MTLNLAFIVRSTITFESLAGGYDLALIFVNCQPMLELDAMFSLDARSFDVSLKVLSLG